MSSEEDPIWAAVLEAEDLRGDAAEDYARLRADEAKESGDMLAMAIWEAAAHALHVLHSINHSRARPRSASSGLSGANPDI